ncbi:unnamed protein product [Rhodiola kirilowii]
MQSDYFPDCLVEVTVVLALPQLSSNDQELLDQLEYHLAQLAGYSLWVHPHWKAHSNDSGNARTPEWWFPTTYRLLRFSGTQVLRFSITQILPQVLESSITFLNAPDPEGVLGPPQGDHIARYEFKKRLQQDAGAREDFERQVREEKARRQALRQARVVPDTAAELIEYFLDTEAQDIEFEIARLRTRLNDDFFAHLKFELGQLRFAVTKTQAMEDRVLELEALQKALMEGSEAYDKMQGDLVKARESLAKILTSKNMKQTLLDMVELNEINRSLLTLLDENIASAHTNGISIYDPPDKVIPRWKGPPMEKAPEFLSKPVEQKGAMVNGNVRSPLSEKSHATSPLKVENGAPKKPKTIIEGSDGSVKPGKKNGKEFWQHTKKWSRGFLELYNAETDPEMKATMKDIGKDLDRWITEEEIQEAAELIEKMPEKNKAFIQKKVEKIKREMELFGPQAVKQAAEFMEKLRGAVLKYMTA